MDGKTRSSQQIDGANKVMVAVQDVIFPTPQLITQGADKLQLL